MDTEDSKQEASLQQTDSENTHTDIDSTLVDSIGDKYQQMLAICNDLSEGSKTLPSQATQLLDQATALYDEAQRLTPKYRAPKSNTPQE
jgi:hypothetical protein